MISHGDVQPLLRAARPLYGDIRADKRPPVLFDEMLRQDYQFNLGYWKMPADPPEPACGSAQTGLRLPARPMTAGSSTTGRR